MRIRALGIVKEFGDAAALRGVDLDIRSGELMALLGPSGSGKTTLLRIVAGLEIPDEGRILFGDEDATSIPVRKRQVGFVFQHYALFRHMSVFDNIAFGLRAWGRRRPGRADIARRVGDLLRLVELGDLADRRPNQLSGGQRQRVALARAMAVEPRVLLLDEPFGALDARVRRDLRRSLRDIHDATGQTTIFVTHDQDEALELADRVAVLNGGRIEQVGTPDEVHDRPASAFVMSFVGESSFLPVQVADGRVLLAGRELPFGAGDAASGTANLHVRPVDVAFSDDPDALAGRVTAIRRATAGRRAEVTLEGEKGRIVETDIPEGRDVARGDRVTVEIRGGRLFPTG